jgi:hypothetical protein
MFRTKRADTLVGTIEKRYRVDLNARSNAKLGNLLRRRGFASLTQLTTAARGNLKGHAKPRRVFLSFHAADLQQVGGFRLMMQNTNIELAISDARARKRVDSPDSTYVKRVLRQRIAKAEVVVCMIGNGTAWRKWVDWEIATAIEHGVGVCGIRLKRTRGRAPEILREIGAPIASWDAPSMIAAIEQAAALRS